MVSYFLMSEYEYISMEEIEDKFLPTDNELLPPPPPHAVLMIELAALRDEVNDVVVQL